MKVLPDSADEALVADDTVAYIKMTAVKPVGGNIAWPIMFKGPPGNRLRLFLDLTRVVLPQNSLNH